MKIMKKEAFRFIVLLGIVSLFADFTYEGARSIIGPYLSNLGASGAQVGFVVSLGVLIGYGFRAVSGYLSDKTQQYWALTFLGYIINLAAVPLLALTDRWQTAAVLIVMERFGKAIRVPARDALLSYATKHTGRGWGFGIHEALDQIGAVLGPLFLSLIFFLDGSYQLGFAFLSVPAALSLIALVIARISFPAPQEMEKKEFALQALQSKVLTKNFWIYVFGVGLVAFGFADYALISYHFQKASVLSPIWITFLYCIAMGVDGLAALVMGKIFDLKGISVLAFVTAIAAFFAPLVFLGGFAAILFGMVLWGIGMGAQESIMRAIVAVLTSPDRRGSAYGMMNLIFGLFWAAGSALIGFLYDLSPLYTALFCLIAQFASLPFFLSVKIPK